MQVTRPIVRSFKAKFLREAALHVRGGGHAVVWHDPKRAVLVLPTIDDDDPHDWGLWSILDIGKKRWRTIPSGPLRGLSTALVPPDCHAIVRRRAERDSVHPGPTRAMELDCLECGACCRDNEVILLDVDVERLRAGGKAHIAKPPYARRRDGKLTLSLLKNGRCQHLADDNKCGIYAHRPDSCS